MRETCALVVRNHQRVMVLSARNTYNHISCPLHAELRAILFGLETIHSFGLQVHHFETDCLITVKEIDDGAMSFSKWRNIILDIFSLNQFVEF